MEYKEAPCILHAERRINFSSLVWLDKRKFEEYLKQNKEIYPNIKDEIENNYIYIGKTIPKSYLSINNWEQNKENLQILGTVFKNNKGNWQLNVPYNCEVSEIYDNFLVLNIEDKESFCWIKTSKAKIPRFALRAAIDEQTNEYLYIGTWILEFLS